MKGKFIFGSFVTVGLLATNCFALASCGNNQIKDISIEEGRKHVQVDGFNHAYFIFHYEGIEKQLDEPTFIGSEPSNLKIEQISPINNQSFNVRILYSASQNGEQVIPFGLRFKYKHEGQKSIVTQDFTDLSVIVPEERTYSISVETNGVYLTNYYAKQGKEFKTYVFLENPFDDFKSLTVKKDGSALISGYTWDPWTCILTIESSQQKSGLSIEAELYTPEISKPFTIENKGNSSLDLWIDHAHSSRPEADLKYSFDGLNWEQYEGYQQHVTIQAHKTIQLKGTNPNGWSKSSVDYNEISISFLNKNDCNYSLSGNIMSLVNESIYPYMIFDAPDYCFYKLFANSNIINDAKLIDAQDLIIPVTSAGKYCFYWMFNECNDLVNAPQIYALDVKEEACQEMFRNCESLVRPPRHLYTEDISNARCCYDGMFYGCSSLNSSPFIEATSVGDESMKNMFLGCTSLKEITISFAGDFTHERSDPNSWSWNWVKGVSQWGTIHYNGSDTTTGDSAIPNDWTVQPFNK